MPRMFLRCSFAALTAIALVAASVSSSAQAQAKFKNVTGATKGTDISPWTTTHGSNPPYRSSSVGRNDGYVQRSPQGSHFQPTKQYDVQVGWWERAQRAKGQNTLRSQGAQKGSDAIRSTPAVQLNRFSNTQAKPQGQVRSQMMFTVGHINGH